MRVDAGPVHLLVTPGGRDLVGTLLAVVPRPIRRTTAWAALVDLPARRMLPGVRTRGVGPGGRRQWYCALDHRPLTAAAAWLDGAHLGNAIPIDPPVSFGFSSAPARPAWVRVVSVIEADAPLANVAR